MKKRHPLIVIVILSACTLANIDASATNQNPPASGCVRCHTDVKKLIRLSWEVERVRGKPRVSAEIEGEG